jgi:hypothetical protein
LQRDEELAAALAARVRIEANAAQGHLGYLEYRAQIGRVRELVAASLPAIATVAVVSKGDEALLELEGRTAWHLPQTEEGVYLGHHPADGPAAVDQLEWLRERGAEFFLLPGSAWWWLDHYSELREHLERHYSTVLREEGECLIVDLRAPQQDSAPQPTEEESAPAPSLEKEPEEPEPQEARREPEREAEERMNEERRATLVASIRELVRESVPRTARVAVVSRGDEELLRLDGRSALHLPQGAGGVYAGYHPADSVTAIAQLEALREEGAEYLVIPATQMWWLDYYADFAQLFEQNYRLIARRDGVGVVYDLSGRRGFLPWRRKRR